MADTTYKMQNSKLIKVLTSTKPEYQEVDPLAGFSVFTCSKNKIGTHEETSTQFVMRYDDLTAEIDNENSITWEDRIVMDAIFNIWRTKRNEDGNCVMSYLDIYRASSGKNADKLNRGVEEKIEKVVRKLRCLDITIKIDNESSIVNQRAEQFKGVRQATIRGHAIMATEFNIVHRNGEAVKGIEVYDCPILWKYAIAMKHFLSVDKRLLNVPGLYVTDKMSAIRNFLILHVKSLRAGQIKSKKIYVEKLLNEAGVDVKGCTRADIARMRKTISKILDHFVNMEFIKSYGFEDKNKSVMFEV